MDKPDKFKFFYQSGWIAVATAVGGGFMYAVHMLAKEMPKAEYGVFTTLLQVINLMGIPAIGLQTVFAQQAAGAVDDPSRRRLVGTVQAVMQGTFWLWVVMAVGILLTQNYILSSLKITHAPALWITMVIGLFSLWLPVMSGLLQGRQDFLWYGGVSILGGLGRFLGVCVLVYLLGGHSPSAMMAVLAGILLAIVVAGWRNRECWLGPALRMDWKDWLGRVVPLTLGAGATLLLMSADMIFVQKYFAGEETGYYAAAGMIGRALVFFTAPVAAVMFPKVVRSAATGEKSSILLQAVGVTALMGVGAALFCTVFPELPLRVVYDKSFLKVAPLVPWFAWCMLPLTLANVLVSSLLARKQFGVVPWMMVVAAGYAVALQWRASTVDKADLVAAFSQVVMTLGVFGTLLLAVCLVYSLRGRQATTGAKA